MKRLIFSIIFLLLFIGHCYSAPLTVHPTNTRYFTDGSGRAILLAGSHTWANLSDMDDTDPPVTFDFDTFLDMLVTKGHTHMRLWGWCCPYNNIAAIDFNYCSQFPWRRTGPGNADDGKLKFDLTKFDPIYFDRMRDRIIKAGNKGIYVSIILYEYSILTEASFNVDGFPFWTDNNINTIAVAGTGAYEVTSGAVYNIHVAYMQHVVDMTYDLYNVLYEIINEPAIAAEGFAENLLADLNTYQAGKSQQHPVGLTSQWDAVGAIDTWVFASDAEYVSPGFHTGANDWNADAGGPVVNDGTKVVLVDTDHIGNNQQVPWSWKVFMRGHQPIYMDAYEFAADFGDEAGLRNALGRINYWARKINLANLAPSSTISSTTYALFQAGEQYLVYQPSAGAFTVDLVAGSYLYEYYDPDTGSITATGTTTATGGNKSFTIPYDPAVLYLKKPPIITGNVGGTVQ